MTGYDDAIGYDSAIPYNGAEEAPAAGGGWFPVKKKREKVEPEPELPNRNKMDDILLAAAWMLRS